MSVLMTPSEFADALDASVDSVWDENYREQESYIDDMYRVVRGDKQDWKYSEEGSFGDIPEFESSITYQTRFEGYDGTITPVVRASGYQVDEVLNEDSLWFDFEDQIAQLARSVWRTREGHAHDEYNMGFSVYTDFNVNSEGVALFSSSHTNRSGTSTASGFDNAGTSSMSATAVAATRRTMAKFVDSRGNIITVNPDLIWCGTDKYDVLQEIIGSQDKPGTANRTTNVHQEGTQFGYKARVSQYHNVNANNWGMVDTSMERDNMIWFEKRSPYYGTTEAFDNFQHKTRVRMRYGTGWRNWRHVFAHDV